MAVTLGVELGISCNVSVFVGVGDGLGGAFSIELDVGFLVIVLHSSRGIAFGSDGLGIPFGDPFFDTGGGVGFGVHQITVVEMVPSVGLEPVLVMLVTCYQQFFWDTTQDKIMSDFKLKKNGKLLIVTSQPYLLL